MKTLLIGLLVAHSAMCIMDGIGPYSRGSCLQKINEARSAFADKYQIANMNDLVYEKKLEKNIREQLAFHTQCPQSSIISHRKSDVYLNVQGKELIVELLSSTGNTKIACVQSQCDGQMIMSIATDFSDSPAIRGPPGTQCSSGRFSSSNGLCTFERHRQGYARKGFWGDVWDEIKGGVEKMGKSATQLAKEAQEIGEKMVEYEKMKVLSPMILAGGVYTRKGFFDDMWDVIKSTSDIMEEVADDLAQEAAVLVKETSDMKMMVPVIYNKGGYARKGFFGDMWDAFKDRVEAVAKTAAVVVEETKKVAKEVLKGSNDVTEEMIVEKQVGYARKRMLGDMMSKMNPTPTVRIHWDLSNQQIPSRELLIEIAELEEMLKTIEREVLPNRPGYTRKGWFDDFVEDVGEVARKVLPEKVLEVADKTGNELMKGDVRVFIPPVIAPIYEAMHPRVVRDTDDVDIWADDEPVLLPDLTTTEEPFVPESPEPHAPEEK